MNFHILRHAASLAFLTAAAVPACTSDATPPTVFMTSYIQGTADLGPLCGYQSQKGWIEIGAPTGVNPATVPNGGTQGGGRVSVGCTVHPVGNGFDVALNASLSGQGSVTITSAAGMGAISPTSGGPVSMTFQSTTGNYNQQDCMLTYMYDQSTVPASPPIAAGRIWAHASCPKAQDGTILIMLSDGGADPATCDTEADFRFEFCGE